MNQDHLGGRISPYGPSDLVTETSSAVPESSQRVTGEKMVKRFDIEVMLDGEEASHGHLVGMQVQQIFQSMPVGATMVITRNEDTDDSTITRIGYKLFEETK